MYLLRHSAVNKGFQTLTRYITIHSVDWIGMAGRHGKVSGIQGIPNGTCNGCLQRGPDHSGVNTSLAVGKSQNRERQPILGYGGALKNCFDVPPDPPNMHGGIRSMLCR